VDYWKSLTKEQQEIFHEAAKLCIDVNRTVNAALHESLPKLDMSIDDYAKANDIEIINLTPAEREVFRVAMTPVWDKYRKLIGDDLFDFMLDKIKVHQQ
jgi:TRAP-type C4-dicarboxylate transport system substrate-binding protein